MLTILGSSCALVDSFQYFTHAKGAWRIYNTSSLSITLCAHPPLPASSRAYRQSSEESVMRSSSKGEIHAGIWGMAAGVVGSLCCIGPSAAILLGLGASS